VVGVVVHAQVLPEAQPGRELQLHVVGRVEAQRSRFVLGLLQVNERVGRRVPRDVVFAGNGVGVGGSGVGGRKKQGRADDARRIAVRVRLGQRVVAERHVVVRAKLHPLVHLAV
nr:hypothetical protein [Tanacetum cinerariifolium]